MAGNLGAVLAEGGEELLGEVVVAVGCRADLTTEEEATHGGGLALAGEAGVVRAGPGHGGHVLFRQAEALGVVGGRAEIAQEQPVGGHVNQQITMVLRSTMHGLEGGQERKGKTMEETAEGISQEKRGKGRDGHSGRQETCRHHGS